MSASSAIEWTDATWNPVRGCTKVSPGCAHCYAETFAERFRGVKGHPYEQGFDLRLVPEKLHEPLKWKKPRRVFVNSMSDLFQDGVPDEYIDRVFAVMALTPQHTYQVLTKRAERMRAYFEDQTATRARIAFHMGHVAYGFGSPEGGVMQWGGIVAERWANGTYWPMPNVWLGVSVENQHFADERIPRLLQTPAAVRFISAEPLLGRVDLAGFIPKRQPWKPYIECRHGYDACPICDANPSPALDWVIVGGESGHGARPFDLAWGRNIVQQCKAARVPVFVKQLGANPYDIHDGPDSDFRDLRDSKGGDMAEWPADLQVREFPEVHS